MDYTPVSSAGAAPNPLRPYYIPPSVGPDLALPNHTARALPSASSASLSSTARDLLPELGLEFKNSAGEAWQNTRSLFDALLYKYMSVLLAQPFDVAKIVLQVSSPPSAGAGIATPKRRRRVGSRQSRDGRESSIRSGSVRSGRYAGTDDEAEATVETDEDSDDNIPDYFTSTAPRSRSPRKRRRTPPSSQHSPTPTPRNRRDPSNSDLPQEYDLRLKRPDSVTHVLSQLYTTSGAVGLWRATNCTFLYNVLLRSTDTFLRSLLLAVLGLPDIAGPVMPSGLLHVPTGSMGLNGLDLSDSPNALASLVVVAISSSLAALLLSPLDLVRTRLVLTPTSHRPRGLVQTLRRLPTLLCPSSLWLPTTLAHSLPQLFTAATPLLLRRQLKLSPETSPSLWSLLSFTTSLTDLFLRLPLETLERRAQLAALKDMEPLLPTIVETAPWKGVGGTVYSILYHEGETRATDVRTGLIKVQKGQGAAGLVRGWRVGFWGLVGVWGAGMLGGGEGKGRGEF